jgi:hypothetical protein
MIYIFQLGLEAFRLRLVPLTNFGWRLLMDGDSIVQLAPVAVAASMPPDHICIVCMLAGVITYAFYSTLLDAWPCTVLVALQLNCYVWRKGTAAPSLLCCCRTVRQGMSQQTCCSMCGFLLLT